MSALAPLLLPADAIAGPARMPAELVENVVVRGPLVMLSDLFRHVEPGANKPIFRAPDPGTTGHVSVSRVLRAGRKFGLEVKASTNLRKISISRASRIVRASELQALVRDEIDGKFPQGELGELVIEFASRQDKYHLPVHITDEPQLGALNWSARSGNFRATINVGSFKPIKLKGKAQMMTAVVMPKRDIQRGAVITASDLAVKKINARRLRTGTVTSTADIVGMAALRRLRVNVPVAEKDLEMPKLIRRNQLVTILLEIPGLVLRAEGKALADAALGDAVKVMNTQSKRVIHATVKGQGLVSVTPSQKGRRPGT